MAVDPATGQPRWTTAPLDPGGSTFTTVAGALVHLDYGAGDGSLTRIDPSTGRVRWREATEPYAVAGAAGVIADTESTSYQTGAASVVGRNAGNGAVIWRAPLDEVNLIHASLLTLNGPDGPVLVLADDTTLVGYDPATAAPWSNFPPATP